MNSEVKGIDVNIMGREFRVACRDGEQQELLSAVDYLDKKMKEIRDQGKVVGLDRIAIMAGLNIAHEFLSMRTAGNFDTTELKRRITKMQTMLDQAMSDQDELF